MMITLMVYSLSLMNGATLEVYDIEQVQYNIIVMNSNN